MASAFAVGRFAAVAYSGSYFLGVAVLLLTARQHRVVLRQLERGEPLLPPSWSLGIVLAVLLAIIGAAMVVYLSLVSR